MNRKYIDLEIQGGTIRRFTDLVLDYTGTLSLDGVLLPGVAERLARISAGLRITIMTADTFGKAVLEMKTAEPPSEILTVQEYLVKYGMVNRLPQSGINLAFCKAVNLDIHIIAC